MEKLSPPFLVAKSDMVVQVAVVDRLILYFQSFCMKTCQSKAHEDWFLRDNFGQHYAIHQNLLLLNRKTHFCSIDAHQHIYVLVIIENTFSRIRNYICKEEHDLICVMESMSYDEMVR